MNELNSCLDDEDFINFINLYDIVFCSETWCKPHNNPAIEGYQRINVPRPEYLLKNSRRGHGGVCLFLRDYLSKSVSVVEIDNHGIIWIKIDKDLIRTEVDMFVCFMYIPPQSSCYYNLHNEGFFEYLERTVRLYSNIGLTTVCGDLNARCGTKSDVFVPDLNISDYIPTINRDDLEQVCTLNDRCSTDKIVNPLGNKLIDLCINTNLKIVNGRCGSDAGIGDFTFMSDSGNSLIDYVLAPYELFEHINNFVVHDFFSFSPHAPIEISFNFNMNKTESSQKFISQSRIVWSDDTSMRNSFVQCIQDKISYFSDIVDNIVAINTSVDQGVDSFSDLLHQCAFKIYGTCTRKPVQSPKFRQMRKYKSPWFNAECETARRNYRSAKRSFGKNKSIEIRGLLLQSRKTYNSTKIKARRNFQLKQRDSMHKYAKSDPQKFWKEIRKLNLRSEKNDISPEEFFEHFKDLFCDRDTFTNDEVEQELPYLLQENAYIDSLDKDFSIDEVNKAIASLKRGKSGGIDNLIPEIFKDSKELLSPLLCIIFNYIYSTGIYPASWTKGVIFPVPKKGDKNNVNNYRGITLTSIFSKIFSILLDNRLRNWDDENEILNEYQFGFRNNKSTTDCIFVLNYIINKVLHEEKRKLYCAFVDFKKAFDLVYRNGILFKLLEYKVSSKFVIMLQSIYSNVKSCVKNKYTCNNENQDNNTSGNNQGMYSNYFDSYSGVKQGEPLSPLLFIMFINDMHGNLDINNIDSITVDDLNLFLLLFADDTVLFSYSIDGLEILLNKLHSYCIEWGISVNTEKQWLCVLTGVIEEAQTSGLIMMALSC